MYCKKCGKYINDGVKYCSSCGEMVEHVQEPTYYGENQQIQNDYPPIQPVQYDVQNTPKKTKSGKGVAGAIVAVVLSVALILSFLNIIPSIDDIKAFGVLNEKRIEGKGYNSPEEVVEAYIKALNCGDIDGVLSTFAIESYVDNFDTRAHMKRNLCFTPTAPGNLVYEMGDGREFDRDIRIKMREATLMSHIYTMLSQYTIHHNMMTIGPFTDDEADEFVDNMEKTNFIEKWSKMELVKFIDPDEITDYKYSIEQNVYNRNINVGVYGCEELENVCALVTIDGERYYQFAECGRYNGKWYMITPAGNLSAIMGVSADVFGLEYIE